MSGTLWPHGLQHARLLWPPLSPGVCLNICPLSQWCYWTLFSFWLRSFPALESFPMNQPFPSSGQNTGVSFSFSISPSNECSWLISFTIDWFDLLAVQQTLKSLLQNHNSKALILSTQPSLWSNSHPYMTTAKTVVLTVWQNDVSTF